MATQNKKYLDDQGLSIVADYIKERLKIVTTMPESASNSEFLLYMGTTSGSYISGHIYQYDTVTSDWVDITASTYQRKLSAGTGIEIDTTGTNADIISTEVPLSVNNGMICVTFEE